MHLQLCDLYGTDARLFVITCLLEDADLGDSHKHHNTQKLALISQEVTALTRQANFATLLCQAFEALDSRATTNGGGVFGAGHHVTAEYLGAFASALKLPAGVMAAVALALSNSPVPSVASEGIKYLVANLGSVRPSDTMQPLLLHSLLFLVRTNPAFASRRESLIATLCAVHPRAPTLALAPLLPAGPASDLVDLPAEATAASSGAGAGAGAPSMPKVDDASVSQAADEVLGGLELHELILDLGYAATSSAQTLRQVLSSVGKGPSDAGTLSEEELAKVLAFMANTQSGLDDDMVPSLYESFATLAAANSKTAAPAVNGAATTWNIGSLVEVVRADYPAINWDKVIRSLDMPGWGALTIHAFELIVEVYRVSTGLPFPTHVVLEDWRYPQAQLSLLQYAVASRPEVVTFAKVPGLMVPVEGSPNGCGTANQAWCCVPLYRTLLHIARHGGLVSHVRALLHQAANLCPELLLLALAELRHQADQSASATESSEDPLRDDLFQSVVAAGFKLLGDRPTAMQLALVRRLASISPAVLHFTMLRLYRASVAAGADSSSAIAAVVQYLHQVHGALTSVFSCIRDHGTDLDFALELAVAASMKKELNLDGFLDHMLHRYKDKFALACVSFVGAKTAADPAKQGAARPQIAVDTLVLFFKRLKADQALLSHGVVQMLKAQYVDCCRVFPALAQANNHDIEEQANQYFKKIYAAELSISEVIDMLKQFKNSANERERAIFSCMIHNLFDEYRFFHKYPEKELRITGILFGTLIQHQLVSSQTLGGALRYVLEALRKPPNGGANSKMYRFGLYALDQFKSRLPKWPQYCSHLIAIPHLRDEQGGLVRAIEVAISSGALELQNAPSVAPASPPVKSGDGEDASAGNNQAEQAAAPPPVPEKRRPAPKPVSYPAISFGAPVNARDVLLGRQPTRVVPPAEEVVAKVHFVVNNVTTLNMKQKTQELQAVLRPPHYSWFSHYLIVKRVSSQPNFHAVYRNLIVRHGDPALEDEAMCHTWVHTRALLRSDKIRTSSADRSLLKNLGSWIGKMTLARNKPLLQRILDLKALLMGAYQSGKLIGIMAFVAKILEEAATTTVFAPPNPWVMGIMSTLRALYELPDTKLSLRFEVEVLCKKLRLSLQDLRIDPRVARAPAPTLANNPDFNFKAGRDDVSAAGAAGAGAGAASAAATSSGGRSAGKAGAARTASSGGVAGPGPVVASKPADAGTEGKEDTLIPNLRAFVKIQASLPLFKAQPQLTRVVPSAIDLAIREILHPVVERSVTIACITTRELVHKDFGLEPDTDKMVRAAHLMVSNLAGSLALVTCKEPLRVSLNNHIRTKLVQHGGAAVANDADAVKAAVEACANDNLELGCQLIEKSATEKAVRDIDEMLAPVLKARRDHLAKTGQPLVDASAYRTGNKWPAALPQNLRPNHGGLTNDQLAVYEAFNRPRQQLGQTPQGGAPASGGRAEPSGGDTGSAPASSGGRTKAAAAGAHAGNGVSRMAAAATAGTSVPDGAGTAFGQVPKPKYTIHQATEEYNVALDRLDKAVHEFSVSHPGENVSALPNDHEIIQLLHSIHMTGLLTLPQQREEALLAFCQRVFQRVFRQHTDGLLAQVYLAVLVSVRDLCKSLRKELTTWVIYSPTETKYNADVIVGLLRSNMLSLPEYDHFLAKAVDSNSRQAIEFAIAVLRRAVVVERACNYTDFRASLDRLVAVSQRANVETVLPMLPKLLDSVRALATATASGGRGAGAPGAAAAATGAAAPSGADASSGGRAAAADSKAAAAAAGSGAGDPAGLRERVLYLLETWMRVCNHNKAAKNTAAVDNSYTHFLQLLQHHGVLATEQATDRFFRVMTELCVESCLSSATPVAKASQGGKTEEGKPDASARPQTTVTYSGIDAMSKLVMLLVKYAEPVANKVNMLSKVLNVAARVLLRDAETQRNDGSGFDQRPYFRLFINILHAVHEFDASMETLVSQVLHAFANIFHALQPTRVPNFAFAWLELISHRTFMPKLLLSKQTKGWALMHRLVVDLFRFLQPYLRTAELNDAIRLLYVAAFAWVLPTWSSRVCAGAVCRMSSYKGTLRVLLVLLHDMPEFLCDFHFSFCDVIPPSCIQLRNLVLSAFPRNMRLPDPFTPNLKVDLLPEISQPPRVLSNTVQALNHTLSHNGNLLSELDGYLKSRSPASFLPQLHAKLMQPSSTPGAPPVYAVRVINALVFYLGQQAIAQLQDSSSSTTSVVHSAPMDIFQHLTRELAPEGRYLLLNAITNQLRYPNSHTHYFSCVLLYLFAEAPSEAVQEQITRVLLERLIVHRPHPWGLLITFIELIKNPRYDFWSHSFTRCAKEIERLFESVARSCIGSGGRAPGPAGGSEGRGPEEVPGKHLGPGGAF